MDKTLFARVYIDLVKAGRRREEDVPSDLRDEYDRLKTEAETKEA